MAGLLAPANLSESVVALSLLQPQELLSLLPPELSPEMPLLLSFSEFARSEQQPPPIRHLMTTGSAVDLAE